MHRVRVCIVCLLIVGGTLTATRGTPPQLPSDHPPTVQRPPANPDDVQSVGAILSAYYGSISAAANTPRDWDRFRSLFLPTAHLVTVVPGQSGTAPLAVTPEQFVRLNAGYFEGSGYVERALREEVTSFADIANVVSTYESKRAPDEPAYARGVNSFQMVQGDGRWWIVSVVWDRERNGFTLPERLAPRSP